MTPQAHESLAELVRRRTGLRFTESRAGRLRSGADRVMRDFRIADTEELLARLASDPVLMDELVSEITVGETYFFRHPEQLDVIRARILRPLLAEREGDVRVWVAGCASGEEAYSLAIMALELGAGDRIRILATDLSRRALHEARARSYRPWSLRAAAPATRARYFTRRKGRYELDPRVAEMVDLAYLNLADDAYPSLARGLWGVDLILCRNVLMYFDPTTTRAVGRRLLDTLRPTGWLVLGPSDPLLGDRIPSTVVSTDAGLFYRQEGAGPGARPLSAPQVLGSATGLPEPPTAPASTAGLAASATEEEGATEEPLAPREQPSPDCGEVARPVEKNGQSDAEPPAERAAAAYATGDYEATAREAVRATRGPAAGADAWLLLVRSLANIGRVEEARTRCVEALDAHPAVPELHSVHALLLADAGAPLRALEAARRAVYLDRSFAMGHVILARAFDRTGDVLAAGRSYRNARALLAGLPANAAVPGSDGATAGRLIRLVETHLELLGEAA